MKYETKMKIYNNPNLLKYLRENSVWYKRLNRDESIIIMEEEMKEKYGLRMKDKVDKIGTGIDLLNAFIDATKE